MIAAHARENPAHLTHRRRRFPSSTNIAFLHWRSAVGRKTIVTRKSSRLLRCSKEAEAYLSDPLENP